MVSLRQVDERPNKHRAQNRAGSVRLNGRRRQWSRWLPARARNIQPGRGRSRQPSRSVRIQQRLRRSQSAYRILDEKQIGLEVKPRFWQSRLQYPGASATAYLEAFAKIAA